MVHMVSGRKPRRNHARTRGTEFKYKRFDAVEAAPRNISTLSGAKRVVANTGSASWKRSKAGAYGDDAHAMEGGTK